MRSDQRKLARSNERAHLNRDELEAAPGAALAYRRVRAAGAAARTRRLVHCKRRAGSAQLCIRRVIGARSAELLRALNRQGGAGPRSHRRRTQGRRTRGRVPCCSSWRCKARERAPLLVKAQARAAVGLAGGVLLVVVIVHTA